MPHAHKSALRALRSSAVAIALAGMTLVASGCRVDEDDVLRWETTLRGPDKLKAVLYHEKYELPLRVQSALSLIKMQPRKGRQVGIPILVETLAEIDPTSRKAIISSLVPSIIKELKKEPPVAQAGQPAPPDDSYAFKDAAYAMLTEEKTVIVDDEGLKASLDEALIEWAMADFEPRLLNRTQAYGMEQLLRYLGSPSVKKLPEMMTATTTQLDKMARLVAELGDADTKQRASAALVKVGAYVVSDEWVKKKTPELQAANKASKLEPTEKQFQAQLEKYQDEELIRVFGSMKRIGGRPVIDWALDYATNDKASEKRRQAALASLEGHLDKEKADDLDRIFKLAQSDAPPPVLDQAFRRIGELPREVAVERLYKMFETEKWKIRRAAAATVIQMSKVDHIPEFMGKLPSGEAKGFALPEVMSYGAQLGDMKGGKPIDKLKPFMEKGEAAQRTTALAWYLTHGSKKDAPALEPYKNDGQTAPVCETDGDCKWACYVPKEGAKDPKKEKELKDVRTIGDFVSYCVLPNLKSEEEKKQQAAEKEGDGGK